MTYFIYRIIDAEGQVRYVGKSNNPYRRLLGHYFQDTISCSDRFHDWLRGERLARRMPDIRIVKIAEGKGFECEKSEIKRCRLLGYPLLNRVGNWYTEPEGSRAKRRADLMEFRRILFGPALPPAKKKRNPARNRLQTRTVASWISYVKRRQTTRLKPSTD